MLDEIKSKSVECFYKIWINLYLIIYLI
jgi:hypothetical protein